MLMLYGGAVGTMTGYRMYRPGTTSHYRMTESVLGNAICMTSFGVLKSVNVESTTDQGKTLSNVASSAKDYSSLVHFDRAELPACSDGEALVGLDRYDFPQ